MMTLSMVLPWESLSDYTYSESMGLLMNIIPAIIFAVSSVLVIFKPLALVLSRFWNKLCFLVTLPFKRCSLIFWDAILSRYLHYRLFAFPLLYYYFYVGCNI